MERLNELYGYKARYEQERLFIDAKISVIDDMIADQKAKCIEQRIADPIEYPESVVEETVEQTEDI